MEIEARARDALRHLREPSALERQRLTLQLLRRRRPELPELVDAFGAALPRNSRKPPAIISDDPIAERQQAKRQQDHRPQLAQRVDDRAADRIQHEDVAVPNQIRVDQPKHQQREHAPVVKHRRA